MKDHQNRLLPAGTLLLALTLSPLSQADTPTLPDTPEIGTTVLQDLYHGILLYRVVNHGQYPQLVTSQNQQIFYQTYLSASAQTILAAALNPLSPALQIPSSRRFKVTLRLNPAPTAQTFLAYAQVTEDTWTGPSLHHIALLSPNGTLQTLRPQTWNPAKSNAFFQTNHPK